MTSFRVRLLDETPSTNEEVKRALEADEAEGLVVRARRQVAGYGRQGRAWASPEGGLYCSLLLRPRVEPGTLPTLSLVVGLAVRQTLASFAEPCDADAIQIKWPNDVVLAQPKDVSRETSVLTPSFTRNSSGCHPERNASPFLCHPERAQHSTAHWAVELPSTRSERREAPRSGDEGSHTAHAESLPIGTTRDPSTPAASLPALRMTTGETTAFVATFAKLCGISLEAHAGGVCAGVGVNVLPPDERPDVGGKNRPAYVADLAGDMAGVPSFVTVEGVLDAFLAAFAPLYERWQRDGFEPFVDEFNAHASLAGCNVRMVDRQDNLLAAGTVVRVDAQGRLVLRAPDGAEIPVSSGEAHLAPFLPRA